MRVGAAVATGVNVAVGVGVGRGVGTEVGVSLGEAPWHAAKTRINARRPIGRMKASARPRDTAHVVRLRASAFRKCCNINISPVWSGLDDGVTGGSRTRADAG